MNRPMFPIGCKPDGPEWRSFQIQMEAYIKEHRWDYLDGIPKTQPQAEAMNSGMLTAPRKAKKPAWSGVDREYLAEAKRRQGERDKAAPRPCADCKVGVRLPRKARCFECDEKAQDRIEAAKNHRKCLIEQGLTARKRGECLA